MPATQSIDINSRKSIFSIIYLVVVSVCVFIIQPGIIQAFVEDMSLTAEQAGYVAAAEMWGMAVATIALMFFASRINWRTITTISLILATAGNLASVIDTSLSAFIVIRIITGLGLGAMITIPLAMLGMTKKTDYNFGLAVFWLLLYGAVGLYLIPSALETVGLDGIFIFLSAFCAFGLLLVPNLPTDDSNSEEESGSEATFTTTTKIITLLSILSFNIGIGAVWAYLFLVGLEAGISEQGVASILTFSQFLGMLGTLLVIYLSSRVSRGLPMTIAVLGCALSISLLLSNVNFLIYSIAIYGFNFLWNIAQPYLLATLAAFNDQSKTIVRGTCMQMIGFAVGPFIAATIVGNVTTNSFYWVNFLAAVLCALAWLLLIPAIRAQKNSTER